MIFRTAFLSMTIELHVSNNIVTGLCGRQNGSNTVIQASQSRSYSRTSEFSLFNRSHKYRTIGWHKVSRNFYFPPALRTWKSRVIFYFVQSFYRKCHSCLNLLIVLTSFADAFCRFLINFWGFGELTELSFWLGRGDLFVAGGNGRNALVLSQK